MNGPDTVEFLDLLVNVKMLLHYWGKGDDREIHIKITSLDKIIKEREERLKSEKAK